MATENAPSAEAAETQNTGGEKLPFIKILGDSVWDFYKSLESRGRGVSLENIARAVVVLKSEGRQFKVHVNNREQAAIIIDSVELLKELINKHNTGGPVGLSKVSASLKQAKELLLGSSRENIKGLVANNKKVDLSDVESRFAEISKRIKDRYADGGTNYRAEEEAIWSLVNEARLKVVSHLEEVLSVMGPQTELGETVWQAKIAKAKAEENLGARIGAMAALKKEWRSDPFGVQDPDFERREGSSGNGFTNTAKVVNDPASRFYPKKTRGLGSKSRRSSARS